MSISRFTCIPGTRERNVVAARVWGIRFTSKRAPSTAFTVRLTPSTAMEPLAATRSLMKELSRAVGVSSIYGGWLWVDVALHVIEFGLAVAIGVLLIVPAANRYFSAGPGRRFADGGTEVRSTHDRP